jgi:stage V sporulation protein D (sporulation-specific penicillin-binding protein)
MTSRLKNWRMITVDVLSLAAVCAIFLRIVDVQIIDHDEIIEDAHLNSEKRVSWLASRGSIFDRNGLPLAVSHRTYVLGVTPRDLPGDDDELEVLSDAASINRSFIRRLLNRKDDYIRLARKVSLSCQQEEKLSSMQGVRLDPDPERINPFHCMAPLLLGSVGDDNAGKGGLELMFDDYLRGTDGWKLMIRDARGRLYRRTDAPGRRPENGHDLYLTIDSRIQAIVDFELEQAVSRYGAASGAAVVVDPWTGEIYALAEKEGSKAGKIKTGNGLYSTGCIYEPGSTFKLVTAAYLLEQGEVDPYDVFYGEEGRADFWFGTFNDDHKFGWLTFKEAFKKSSNICTIKAVMDTDRDDFYAFLLRFGFGSRTGIDLPAESAGALRRPEDWSARSLPSMAIGQEIGVTVVQMAMAYCAVANGGDLMVPRIAREVRDPEGGLVRKFDPVRVRKVLSPETARKLRGFCREVVVDGTGVNAAVDGIETAGKTGTAQVADGSRYLENTWIASFAGFAPADDPKLVCMVVLKEPDYRWHYGGSSSALVFSEIVEGINLASDLFAPEAEIAVDPGQRAKDMIAVPSFFRLRCAEAEQLASDCDLYLAYTSGEGEVYSQVPGPGTLVQKGGKVSLSFISEGGAKEAGVMVPDLRGLSIRQARRMLIESGLRSRIAGSGRVQKQDPPPGRKVSKGTTVSIRCSAAKNNEGSELALAGGAAR